jgi:hypothetical protein
MQQDKGVAQRARGKRKAVGGRSGFNLALLLVPRSKTP